MDAQSVPPPGSGTQGAPFEISTAQQLAYVATMVNSGDRVYQNGHFKLLVDIDLSTYNNWTPIGKCDYSNGSEYFHGVFDGGGRTVFNLNISNNHEDGHFGLFGYVYDASAEIKNLKVSGKVKAR